MFRNIFIYITNIYLTGVYFANKLLSYHNIYYYTHYCITPMYVGNHTSCLCQ